MPLEAATYINDLNASNPPGSDQLKQADDHLRLIKSAVKATFPSLSRPVYLEQARTDLASATTPDLSTPASNYINITGTTQIDGFATEPDGFMRLLRFDAALTLNYNATSLILPTGADIVTAAGDHAIAVSKGSGNWEILAYFRASGAPLVNATQAASETVAGFLEVATDEEIYAATTGNKALCSDDLETAAEFVALTESGGSVAVDWDTFINGSVTIDQNTVIANPTNGQPGTTRRILVQGNDTTDRTITFGNQFLGEVPTITNCDSGVWYMLYLECITTTHFIVTAKRAKG